MTRGQVLQRAAQGTRGRGVGEQTDSEGPWRGDRVISTCGGSVAGRAQPFRGVPDAVGAAGAQGAKGSVPGAAGGWERPQGNAGQGACKEAGRRGRSCGRTPAPGAVWTRGGLHLGLPPPLHALTPHQTHQGASEVFWRASSAL